MKILITGSDGFVGRHMTKYFTERRHEVIPCDLKDGEDVRDGVLMDNIFRDVQPDAVIHLAWIADARRSNEDPYESFEVGCLGTLNVLEAASRVGVERFCFMNSSQTYGTTPSAVLETQCFNPQNGYARAKVAAVHMIQQYHQYKDLPTVIFTSWEIYGEEAPLLTLIRRFTRLALKDEKIKLYCWGKQATDVNYIENVCHAYDLGLTKPEAVGEMFNVGSGYILTFERLVDQILKLIGSSSKVDFLPPREGEETLRTYPVLTRIHKQLGYSCPISFERGLAKVIEWERQNMEGEEG